MFSRDAAEHSGTSADGADVGKRRFRRGHAEHDQPARAAVLVAYPEEDPRVFLHFHLVQSVTQGLAVFFQHGTVKIVAVLEQKRHIEAESPEHRLAEESELVADGIELPEQDGIVLQAVVQALLNKLESVGKKMGIGRHENLTDGSSFPCTGFTRGEQGRRRQCRAVLQKRRRPARKAMACPNASGFSARLRGWGSWINRRPLTMVWQ